MDVDHTFFSCNNITLPRLFCVFFKFIYFYIVIERGVARAFLASKYYASKPKFKSFSGVFLLDASFYLNTKNNMGIAVDSLHAPPTYSANDESYKLRKCAKSFFSFVAATCNVMQKIVFEANNDADVQLFC